MTDKERAEALREFRKYLIEQGHADAAECLSKLADHIDPPKPEIPDGHVWYQWRSTSGDWIPGLALHGGYMCDLHGDIRAIDDLRHDGWEILPARTAKPGSVVLWLTEAKYIKDYIANEDLTLHDTLRDAIALAEQEVSE